MLFDRIVVGTDGSETATEAVKTAVELAKLSDAKLEIVSAYEPIPQQRLREEGEGISGDLSHAINPREDVQFVLDKAAAVAKKAKVDVVTHPREGDPADAILDVAEENNADLVLVGNKGMTGARRFLLGSVPNKISHHAPCDVWIVKTT
jgi:nucleotide-binding universal stress UspA family protein